MSSDEFDVIVVGAGAGGAAAAARLSEDSGCRVRLIEAGPDYPHELTSPPAFFTGGTLIGDGHAGAGAPVPEMDWGYTSQPLRNGRRLNLPRGRLVGGSTMINGCVAVRARPSDFDRWEQLGADGWGWSDVVPFYEAVEAITTIKRYPPETWTPFQHACVEGWLELGFRYAEDMNHEDAWNGVVGAWPQARRNEVRQGTLVTYVRAARQRPNFTVEAQSLVDRVLTRDGRATGVRYVSASGQMREASADAVVLAAGVYGSPGILMRSGIGPAAQLIGLGVEVVADLPVGANLLEHPMTLLMATAPTELARMTGNSMAVVARGDGWFGVPVARDEINGICGLAVCFESDAKGSLTLTSVDPAAMPVIDHGLQERIDRGDFEAAWEDAKHLFDTDVMRLAGVLPVDPDRPLADVLEEKMGVASHASGGCAIGAVVDPQLAVFGVEGLWVADSSVFPASIANNTMLTCTIIGERAAAFVAKRPQAIETVL